MHLKIKKHLSMKKDIHPKDYRLVAFKDMSNNDIFITKSTANTAETIEHEGVEYLFSSINVFNFDGANLDIFLIYNNII